MGIFNIQSLRDKYLSDSGVPAGQDNRESPSADTASGRRRAGGSSRSSLQDGVARLSARHDLPQRSARSASRRSQDLPQEVRSLAAQKRKAREDESRSQGLHHTGPVTSSINIRAARDIAVAEAEERRAAERAAAEKQAAERRMLAAAPQAYFLPPQRHSVPWAATVKILRRHRRRSQARRFGKPGRLTSANSTARFQSVKRSQSSRSPSRRRTAQSWIKRFSWIPTMCRLRHSVTPNSINLSSRLLAWKILLRARILRARRPRGYP